LIEVVARTSQTIPPSAVRYLDHLETQRNLAGHTLVSYRRELERLARLAAAESLTIEALCDPHIRRYAAKLHAGGLGARSIAHALSTWRGYYRWLAEYEDGGANPVADVRAPKLGKRLPKALSETMTMQLLDAPADDPDAAREAATDEAAIRDAAIHELFYSSGLRLAELVALDVSYANDAGHRSSGWIDLVAGEVTVTGKGGKQRTVPVGSQARDAIARWLVVRDAWVEADPHPLFLSRRGDRISGRSIQTRLKAHAQRVGIPVNVHPHVLRHSFASHMLQATGDLRAVQELLGHASIAATQVYTSLDFKRLAEVYDAAHPRARRK
jgi:integrase/recombinase XerC